MFNVNALTCPKTPKNDYLNEPGHAPELSAGIAFTNTGQPWFEGTPRGMI
ncbi:hypothetical protein F442_14713 [Phytophthora nicotianae P10297]|uniref:Uncharacterized protein n=4 Tax=Phytophthora nicotianae TaxID=4792 RepID=V9EJX5_PHYNI|nr:hypothetical protein F443_14877 [Phytophthora nicotianae P1569]ETK79710.1 hypothetical protein L915_14454 [Phytophthora nicotianae]ETL86402.1 hypothetical protein L917_14164 [Phytophthora nicotianae]ETO68282.1 hypothetical protein F444_14865 [Phytophthora nicotianae P1976]ETP37479.1 hypothetical protein F442_14713 [Phytophthora nicotianae P10297]